MQFLGGWVSSYSFPWVLFSVSHCSWIQEIKCHQGQTAWNYRSHIIYKAFRVSTTLELDDCTFGWWFQVPYNFSQVCHGSWSSSPAFVKVGWHAGSKVGIRFWGLHSLPKQGSWEPCPKSQTSSFQGSYGSSPTFNKVGNFTGEGFFVGNCCAWKDFST